jgi:UDP-N-acetylglucosamine 2-epimerase (non-hydrolysing)
VTLHRPANVDDVAALGEIMTALCQIRREIPVVFPVHPRTRQHLAQLNVQPATCNLQFLLPLGYLDFLVLQAHASLALTDSGGVQEETTYLGTPCLTARPNTERPATITHGTNRLVAGRAADLVEAAQQVLSAPASKPLVRPDLWDGNAAARVVTRLGAWGKC